MNGGCNTCALRDIDCGQGPSFPPRPDHPFPKMPCWAPEGAVFIWDSERIK
jgi:hypothetical protein